MNGLRYMVLIQVPHAVVGRQWLGQEKSLRLPPLREETGTSVEHSQYGLSTWPGLPYFSLH